MRHLMSKMITVLVVAVASQIYAGETVDKSLDVVADGTVEISNVRGKVEVIGWSENRVSLEGTLDDMTEKLVFETNNKVTRIKVQIPQGGKNHGDGSNLKIHVPHNSRIDLQAVSADIKIKSLHRGVDVRNVSGDIVATEIKAGIHLKTVSGDIDVKESEGDARLNSVSGDIRAVLNSNLVEVNAVSGDIHVDLQDFERLYATVVSGEIKVSGAQQDGGTTTLSSVNGDIEVNFTAQLNARLSIKAGPGGDISNKLTSDVVEKLFPNQQRLTTSVGSGEGRVQLSTVNGQITVSEG